MSPFQPDFPFHYIAADYFTYRGRIYLVVVDRYSNWPIVEQAANGANGLVTALCRTFVTYGISEELTSDGGPEFTAGTTRTFPRIWEGATASLPSPSPTATAMLRWPSRL